jgi:hypothetical protein
VKQLALMFEGILQAQILAFERPLGLIGFGLNHSLSNLLPKFFFLCSTKPIAQLQYSLIFDRLIAILPLLKQIHIFEPIFCKHLPFDPSSLQEPGYLQGV